MSNSLAIRCTTYLILFSMIIGQIGFVYSALLMPKPAHALFGINFTTIIKDIPANIEKILLGVLRGIALAAANKYLTGFIDKLVDKYKIRNYLYYDRVLSMYYLNRYIADKIQDPELRQIYTLLERGYITGQSTGTTGGPSQADALIPQIKRAISEYYIDQGGTDPNVIYNPSKFASDREYYDAVRSYFYNPPSYTEVRLRGQFGAFQSEAATAAQLEVMVGNGLKAGRIIGGTCNTGATIPSQSDLVDTPEKCRANGGTWQASALDHVRSFIDNPARAVDGYITGAIQTQLDNAFHPDFYTKLGSLLGSYLFNRLTLNSNAGVLNEDPNNIQTGTAVPDNMNPIDLDNDGITDGYDIDADGQPDVCVFGGNTIRRPDGSEVYTPGPPCRGSVEANTQPPLPMKDIDGDGIYDGEDFDGDGRFEVCYFGKRFFTCVPSSEAEEENDDGFGGR